MPRTRNGPTRRSKPSWPSPRPRFRLNMSRMLGRMMDFPLTTTHFLERARTLFGDQEIVTRLPDKSLRRSTYAEVLVRCEKLAAALVRLGVRQGDRVATLSWN